ncbi:hypothetical protein [Actinacidiphila soli]|uniref:hypothetical protein n=1 Tax=Actinacidiphila soli TaxID=2487275 RepID=UPI0013E38CCD|nr:hypothetical protein [Actinacidiphila soli]
MPGRQLGTSGTALRPYDPPPSAHAAKIVVAGPGGESVDAVRERHEASGTRYVEVRVAEQGAAEESAATAHARLVARSR